MDGPGGMRGFRRTGRKRFRLDPDIAIWWKDLADEVQRRRLALFREQLARRVCLASPLLLDACGSAELDDASWRLQPGRHWPRVAGTRTYLRGSGLVARSDGPPSHAAEGKTPRTVRRDTIIVRLSERAAHMVLHHGDVSIRTTDAGGRASLPGLMPPETRRWIVGGPLERAFMHPATMRGECLVRSAECDVLAERTTLEFTAPPIEWRLPWARPGSRRVSTPRR